METSGFIEVSQVLDSKPRIFSLPSAIIVPTMFIVVGVGLLGYAVGLSGLMILLSVCVFLTLHFFLFGQEWWRFIVKFITPPNWVRLTVVAVPLGSRGNERKPKVRSIQSSRR